MKKLLSFGAFVVFCASIATAQVMSNPGVENTFYTGFGSPLIGDPVYYGVLDAIQARVDVGNFTLEGMLNWGLMAHVDEDGDLDNFTFAKTSNNPLGYHYGYAEGDSVEDMTGLRTYYNGYVHGQSTTDDYYVNFLWHPLEGLDVGLGTKLNWQVGPAPRFGSWLWESGAHVRQGGFSTHYDDRHGSVGDYQFTPDAPGSADVVGFVPYANKYAKTAIGARYLHEGDFTFQIGAAIPNGTNTDNFRSNVGIQIQFEKFLVAAAYEGLFQKDGNFYAGAEFGVKQFFFDVYFAWDSIDTDDGDNDPEDMAFSTGAAMSINFENNGITLIPEGSINWFENSDYTPAWYAGITFKVDFNETFAFDVYSSFAMGSENKKWDDYDATKDYTGGNIFTIRPQLTVVVTDHNTLGAYLNTEHREAFDGKSRWCWSTGAYWTYKLNTSKAGSRR